MLLCLFGCGDMLKVEKSKNSIIGKTTQEVGEFDPNAGAKVSDSKVRVTDPISAPLQAYGPAVEQIMKSHVAHALDLFHASEDRYPNSHEEFMTLIIKANNIKLPLLPGGKKYQYDVPNHTLVVIEAPEEGAETSAP